MTEVKKVLIFGGKTGWIGLMMGELVKKEGELAYGFARSRSIHFDFWISVIGSD
jgi:hypothetical protein